MEFENILQRLDYYAKAMGLNDNKITMEAGLSIGTLGKSRKGKGGLNSESIEKILCTYTNLSAEWLLTGKGVMITENKTGIAEEIGKQDADPKKIQIQNEFRLKTDSRKEIQVIPLYDIDAAAGLVPLFNETSKQVPIDYISIPNLPGCDGAIHVVGDSMYPLLKSGDIVLFKQVNDMVNGIFYGEMYLLSLDISGDEYVVVKYIQKSDLPGHVKLVSYNSHHSEKEVPLSSIRALAFVKASIRIHSMI